SRTGSRAASWGHKRPQPARVYPGWRPFAHAARNRSARSAKLPERRNRRALPATAKPPPLPRPKRRSSGEPGLFRAWPGPRQRHSRCGFHYAQTPYQPTLFQPVRTFVAAGAGRHSLQGARSLPVDSKDGQRWLTNPCADRGFPGSGPDFRKLPLPQSKATRPVRGFHLPVLARKVKKTGVVGGSQGKFGRVSGRQAGSQGVVHRCSDAGHEAVQHLFLAGTVEIDGEFVTLDRGDVAVAEFLVEDAVADAERGGRVGHGLGHEF